MTQRKPMIGGNWKMNTTLAEARSLARTIANRAGDLGAACDIAVFPPFPYLIAVGQELHEGPVRLGAQDVFHRPNGAYTGEVSTAMLRDVGAEIVLAGHSERRHVIGEDDETVSAKVKAALAAGLDVILCIGETLEQREAGRTEKVNTRQLKAGLGGVDDGDAARVVIAYEPVWAIGTGRTAKPEDAQAVHKVIRAELGRLYDASFAESAKILYGGSVKGNNAAGLFAQPDIDGGLIGGASLDAEEFLAIIRAAASPKNVLSP